MPAFFDVRDFGAQGDGVTSDSKAIQDTINEAAKQYPTEFVDASPWPEFAAVVFFPCPVKDDGKAGHYLLDVAIYVPVGLSMALVGAASHGALLRYTGAGPALGIVGGDGAQAASIERLMFQGGGVAILGKIGTGVVIRDTAFYCVNDWAIASYGDVGWVRIRNCHVTECGTPNTGGVLVGEGAHDWEIASTAFVRNDGSSLVVRGQDVQVRDCDFNTMPVASIEKPFLHIEAPARRCLVQNTRFGNEVTKVGAIEYMPKAMCVVGPLDPVQSSQCILDVRFDRTYFRGAADTPTSLTTPIRVTAPVSGLRVDHCSASNAFNEFIDEAAVEIPFVGDPTEVSQEIVTARNNDNTVDGLLPQTWRPAMQVFSHGGHGFEVQGGVARRITPRLEVGGAGGNMLRATEALAPSSGTPSVPWLWSTLDPVSMLQTPTLAGGQNLPTTDEEPTVSVQLSKKDPPPGTASAVWQIGEVGMGTSCIAQAIKTVAQQTVAAGPLVFSVWLRREKATDLDPRAVRLEIRLLDPALAPLSTSVVVALRHRWIRHAVVAEGVPANSAVMVVVYHGDGISPWSGSFLLARPQLEVGRQPSAYRPVGAVLPQKRIDRPMGARMVGDLQLVFGTGWPQGENEKERRFEAGDRVLSTTLSPKETAPVGWVCVFGGSPGTWRPLAPSQD